MRLSKAFSFGWMILAATVGTMGCRTVPQVPAGPVFYPAPPDPPRIQYLHSFSTKRDVTTKYSWVEALVGPSEAELMGFIKPYGVAVTRGKLYVCDTMGRTVWVVDFVEGTFQTLAGDRRQGKLRLPINLAIDSDGRKYVADAERGQIVVYGPNDEYLIAFGAGENLKPTDVAIAGDRLIVADLNKPEIQIRDKQTGKLIRGLGSPETASLEESVGQPANVAVDAQGTILVSDIGRTKILLFAMDGTFLGSFGQAGKQMGQFIRPKGIAVDRTGRIYVVDAAFENVQIFDDQHRLLMWFGAPPGDEGTLVLPAGMAIDYDNVDYFRKYVAPGYDIEYLIWVVSQGARGWVGCYGLLKAPGTTTAQK